MEIRWIDLYKKNDYRGDLIIAEAEKNIPFAIKRVYCLTNLNDEPRGFHAHRNLQQVVVCLSGNCQFLMDDGLEKKVVRLDQSTSGLWVDKMIWHEMFDFSEDCVLMVLASDHYDEADYIRNYTRFLEWCVR
jgi:dTDP-4-dehydrorhamnose 3,5-epimerase-like enzyme